MSLISAMVVSLCSFHPLLDIAEASCHGRGSFEFQNLCQAFHAYLGSDLVISSSGGGSVEMW